jgi:hypothetical protein
VEAQAKRLLEALMEASIEVGSAEAHYGEYGTANAMIEAHENRGKAGQLIESVLHIVRTGEKAPAPASYDDLTLGRTVVYHPAGSVSGVEGWVAERHDREENITFYTNVGAGVRRVTASPENFKLL